MSDNTSGSKSAAGLRAAASTDEGALFPTAERAGKFNQSCFCITLDREALALAMRSAAGDSAFYDVHIASRPHLFSGVPVFLPEADRAAMMGIVGAIEATARTSAYIKTVMDWAPEISRHDFGPRGVLMGYDFHLGSGPPRLIEINTNAGGAFLNAFGARAQLACCDAVEPVIRSLNTGTFDPSVIGMFEAEWQSQRTSIRPRMVAILDDAPETQYLYPEFLLAEQLLEASSIDAMVADPSELTHVGGKLIAREREIDLVYNRLVDFSLSEPRHAALREAYLTGAVVVTPNPHNHALFADKRNLAVLSDPELLRSWEISPANLSALSAIPRSVSVTPENADDLWARRKRLFFKPVSGHGGKAVYRGDKLTRSVWEAILKADYIAQDLVAPGEREIMLDGAAHTLKTDVRLYTYDGVLLLAAARLYRGQTTNFRTPGGGFAPVFFI
ncbi:conserved hypothetical protein [Hyphomonas neptunium ATCC 15444]|uniref:Uncharacterized protein n=2 Tax=Hyphomonas TaxID=85 RepID=Q0C247_HYPNA|nr:MULTISPECIES: hypothetical protein [Hyphomonas]ABI76684.1 conserved hypothetical protein [Hyphomonas neptunium ATCC 15444]KCZ93090.1 hypothetical protein HHI_10404 [Hyphomonas hirschiana VP5]